MKYCGKLVGNSTHFGHSTCSDFGKNTYPEYMNKIRNPHIRNNFTRLRLDRGLDWKSDDNDFKCKFCNGILSSEHVFMSCTNSKAEWDQLTMNLRETLPEFVLMSPENQVKMILNLNVKDEKAIANVNIFGYTVTMYVTK